MIIARPRPTLLHRLGFAAVVSVFAFGIVADARASGPAAQATGVSKVATTASPVPLRAKAAARPARSTAATKPHRIRTAQHVAARRSAAQRETCGWFWCGPRQVSVLLLGIGF